jgi:small-conductance mechanosensitive channel
MRAVLEAAAGDPLVAFLAMLAAGVALSHLLFRNQPLGRGGRPDRLPNPADLRSTARRYRSLSAAATHRRAHPRYRVRYPEDRMMAVGGLVSGRILHAFLLVERPPHEGRLVHDLLAGVVYLAALFAIVGYVFDLSIQGMLATSGVIAIILGLALQSTLGDVFSGIVLSFSRPYRPGDWISIDGGTEGRVIETNWRATHILTARRDLAIVPNSSIAKSKSSMSARPAASTASP